MSKAGGIFLEVSVSATRRDAAGTIMDANGPGRRSNWYRFSML